jgi:hypothetical protein
MKFWSPSSSDESVTSEAPRVQRHTLAQFEENEEGGSITIPCAMHGKQSEIATQRLARVLALLMPLPPKVKR